MRRRLIRTSILIVCFATAGYAGYLASANLGADALRREAQTQLASLMGGDVQIGRAALVIRGGLFIEGERVGVYPRATVPHRPSLFAARVVAELDVLALLTGRFRLRSLLVDDVSLQVQRDASGDWSPEPVRALATRARRGIPGDLERHLDPLNAFEALTRTLLESPLVARSVEVRRGRVSFVDALSIDADGGPLSLELHQLQGRLVHHWLSDEADLELTGALVDGAGTVVELRAEGRHRREDELHLSIVADGLPLEILGHYLGAAGSSPRGSVSGEISYDTRAAGQGTLTLHAMLEGLVIEIPTRRRRFILRESLVQLDSAVELHPGRVRIVGIRIDSGGVQTRLTGAIERPLRMTSRMRLEASIEGLDLAGVGELGGVLPGEDRRTLEQLIARVKGGRIDHIGGTGNARLARWRSLFLGELDHLPGDFVLRADLSGIRLEVGDREPIRELGSNVEWSGDQIALRNTTARWGDTTLPLLNLTVDGVSHLFRQPPAARRLSGDARSLPGIEPLWRILRGSASEPAERAPPPPVRLWIEALDHPALRWPVRDARLLIESDEAGLQARIAEATWAGAPVRGEAVWARESGVLTIDLKVSAAADLEPVAGAAGPAAAPPGEPAGATEPDRAPWAAGRFEVGPSQWSPLPMRSTRGRFALHGTALDLYRIRADIEPGGKLVARATLRLSDPTGVGVEFKFSLAGADAAQLARAIGLPERIATGSVHLTGEIGATLAPGTPLLASLTGEIKLDARNGEIRRELPVILALAQATQGFNSFADRESLKYEFVKAELQLDGGRISSEDFRLEGPLRVYASGELRLLGPQPELDVVVGVFLFRRAGRLMDSVPLVKAFLPGSERGLVGAYFEVSGDLAAPRVTSLAGKSFTEDLPDILAAPFRALGAVLGAGAAARNEEAEAAGPDAE